MNYKEEANELITAVNQKKDDADLHRYVESMLDIAHTNGKIEAVETAMDLLNEIEKE